MSKAERKRRQDVALAIVGGSTARENNKKGRGEEEKEAALNLKRNENYKRHLGLVASSKEKKSKQKTGGVGIVREQCTTDNIVNTENSEGGSRKEEGEPSGDKGGGYNNCNEVPCAERKSRKKARQKGNRRKKNRLIEDVVLGEVKQTSLEPFPTTSDALLFSLEELEEDSTALNFSQHSGPGLVPASVILKGSKKVNQRVGKGGRLLEHDPAHLDEHNIINDLNEDFEAPTRRLLDKGWRVASTPGDGLMAVLEADSEALWPSDEDNELLSAVREHTDDSILSAQSCEASGWEKTKVNSLLSQHCQSDVMNRRSKQRHTTHLPPPPRWCEVQHDWSTLQYYATIYWRIADTMVNREVASTLSPALLIANRIPRMALVAWVELFEAEAISAGISTMHRNAAMAWLCMQTIYSLEGDLPLILAEIILNILQQDDLPVIRSPDEEEKAQAYNVWINLDAEFHDDQLNLCEFYAGFPNDMMTLDVGLLCRGHLSWKEARIISHMIKEIAKEVGAYQSAHDLRTSYLTLLRGNELAKFSFRKRPAPIDQDLPFQTSLMWRHANITTDCFSINDDVYTQLNRRFDGTEQVAYSEEMFPDTISKGDRVIYWGLRTWSMVSGKSMNCIPHAGKKMILTASLIRQIGDKQKQTESDAALMSWSRLRHKTHQEQMNLCNYYEAAGERYLAAGLTAHAKMDTKHALIVAHRVWSYMQKEKLTLIQAYSRVQEATASRRPHTDTGIDNVLEEHEAPSTAARHQQTEPAMDSTDDAGSESGAAATSGLVNVLRPEGSWKHVIVKDHDTTKFYEQLHKCNYLHEWCNQRWGSIHMSWDAFNKYEDSSLSCRLRLIYWLRRVWYTYHPDWGKHLPPSYDSLLRRYVRDFGQQDRWEARGDAESSLARWRALRPVFHEDQLRDCSLYAKVDPSFMLKGLQADNYLTSADAANILSLLRQGSVGWREGELSPQRLKELYSALLDNRFKLDEDNETVAFYRRLRIGKALGTRAGVKRSQRARNSTKDCLDDNHGVPTLPAGVRTRSVVNDCNGRVGIAKSTLHGAGDGAYALKGIKKNKPIGIYEGRFLKSKSEAIEASRTSDYVFVFGDIAIDAKDSGACTMRFLNDCLNPLLWNCTAKLVNGKVWIYSTVDIEVGQELFLPYGFLYWWKRRHNLPKTLLGECARAYPVISERLNSGHKKLSFSQKLFNRRHRDCPAPKLTPLEKRDLRNESMWAYFPSTRASLNLEQYDRTTLKRRKKKEKLTSSFLEWRRVPTAIRDTYGDMEDDTHTNAGMLLRNGEHDVKVCTWNCGGLSDEKLETYMLYIMRNGINVAFLNDVRGTAVECEFFKKKIKGCLETECFVSSSPVEDPGTPNGKVGGQIVIVCSPWKNAVANVKSDPSGLGGVVTLELKISTGRLVVINSYWPIKPLDEAPSSNALWNKYKRWLKGKGSGASPIDYLRDTLEKQLDKHTLRGDPVIVTGDFNAHWNQPGATYNDLADWASDCCLVNEVGDLAQMHSVELDTFIRGAQPSQIDHILTNINNKIVLSGFGCATGQVWQLFKDHVPIWAQYKIAGGGISPMVAAGGQLNRHSPLLTPNVYKPEHIEEYGAAMSALLQQLEDNPSTEEAGRQLEDICRRSVRTARKVVPHKRKNKYAFNGWSPIYVVLRAQLICLHNIRRGLSGYKGVYWPEEEVAQQMSTHINRWRSVVDRFTFESEEDKVRIMSWTGHGPLTWLESHNVPRDTLLEWVCDDLIHIQDAIKGRKRDEFRRLISHYTRLREKNFQKGLIGSAIRAVSGKVINVFDMKSLRLDEDNLIADDDDIHEAMLDFFEKWHRGDIHSNEGIHSTEVDWLNVYENYETFIELTNQTGVPLALRDLIWQAMQSPKGKLDVRQGERTLREEMSVILNTVPTLEEFTTVIRKGIGGRTPGMTGLTYGLMKIWPNDVVKKVYDLMTIQWTNKSMPEFMKWRWLCPIPKKTGEIRREDLRPLSLVEVLRKSWSSHVVWKMRALWEKYGLIDDSQSAYRAGRGTENALMQVINGLEEAEECATNYFGTSWDKKRAFDSLSRNAARIALYRLGVPEDVCEMLVGIDSKGKTVVRTPKAKRLWEELIQRGGGTSYDDAAQTFAELYFFAMRGVGQGDTPSPFIWNAFFDILLVALKLGVQGKFWVRGRNDKLHSLPDTAYADDMLSPGSDLKILQQKADIVSAFAIIFSFEITIPKLRSLLMQWGNEICDEQAPKLRIYTWGWFPKEVGVGWKIPDGDERPVFPDVHSIKYLGCHIDSNNLYKTLLEETLLMIRRMCRIIGSKKASAEVKAAAAALRVISMATYRGAVGPWSLEKLREWDKPLESLYRKISKCMKSFPAQLLYTTAEQGGLGFPCLSDRIQEEKFARLHRCINTGGDSMVAADGLLLRSARVCGQPTVAGQSATITPIDANYWARSVLEWGMQVGKRLHLGGANPTGTVLAPAHEISEGDEGMKQLLVGLDIATMGDLVETMVTDEGPKRTWLNKRSLVKSGLSEIVPLLRNRRLPTGDLIIRVGSCLTFPETNPDVLEFLGWAEEKVCVRRWTPVERGVHCRVGAKYMISKEHRSRGAGSDELLAPAELLAPSRRVLMGPDGAVGQRQNKHIERKIAYVYTQDVLKLPLTPLPSSFWSTLAGDFEKAGCDLEIYTDASWDQKHGTLHDVFMYGDGRYVTGSGGVVITMSGEDWRDVGIRAIRISNGHLIAPSSAFPLELLSTVVAIKIAAALDCNCKIYTDCLSVQKLLSQKHMLRSMSKREHLVLLQIGMNDTDKTLTQWIPSHPERSVKDKSRWSKHMWGNFLADATAAAEWGQEDCGAAVDHIEVDIYAIMKQLTEEPMWLWINNDGTPSTTSIPNDIKNFRLQKYLADRDRNRVSRGEAPKWVGTKVGFAALQYDLKRVNRGDRARRVRVIWDKGWHGGNAAKGHCDAEEKLCCLCGANDSERHWILGCPHEDCVLIRHEAFGRVTELIEQIDRYDDDAIRMAAVIQDWAWNREDGHKIWTGLWSAELIERLEAELKFGVMEKTRVEKLQAVALSIGRVLADATLELWETKIRKGKRTEIGIDTYTKKLAAAALLRRAKDKKRRASASKDMHRKSGQKKSTQEPEAPSETVKLAFRLATWFGRIPANLTLNEYAVQYANTPRVDRVAGGGGRDTALSSTLVRGRLC